MRSGLEWAMPGHELPEASRVLQGRREEPGGGQATPRRRPVYPQWPQVVLKNRHVKLPYQDFAVFAIRSGARSASEVEKPSARDAAWFNADRTPGTSS